MVRKILRATDHARLVPDRQAHGLGLVEFRVLEGGQTNQPVGKGLGQTGLFKVDMIGQNQLERYRHGAWDSGGFCLGDFPRFALVSFLNIGDIQWMPAPGRTHNGAFHLEFVHEG